MGLDLPTTARLRASQRIRPHGAQHDALPMPPVTADATDSAGGRAVAPTHVMPGGG